MGTWGDRSGRRAVAIVAAIAAAASGVVVGVGSPAAAAITASEQLCFYVSGSSGDAAIVNLTPVRASAAGDGQLVSSNVKASPPVASNVNFGVGSTDPNVAVSNIGVDGEVCFVNSDRASVDLVADHLGTISDGSYTSATSSGAPERVVDTRVGLGGNRLEPSAVRCFEVTGSPGDAAIVNLTPVRASAAGNGQLVSSNVKASPPVASNVNFGVGSTDPNVAVSNIGVDGEVCFVNSDRASVDLVADHLGTLSAGAYTPASATGAPVRSVDTRVGLGGDRLEPSAVRCFEVTGSPGDAAIVNLTPVRASAAGNGQLVSSNVKASPPVASNVNFGVGSTDPNVAVATIGVDGEVCFVNSDRASVDLVADHLGTLSAGAYTPASATGAPVRSVDTRDGTISEPPRSIRPECDLTTTTAHHTATSQVMFGLASRAYEVEPGVALPGEMLHEIGDAVVHFPEQMACWELVAAVRGGHASLGPVTDTEVIVARNVDTDDLVVSFRGTELNLWDILTDVNAFRRSWTLPNGTTVTDAVHAGFAGAYLAVSDQLESVLQTHQRAAGDGTRVYFTGHSLGGALATIASLDLSDELRSFGYETNEIITYTYGAPRSLSTQMVNHHDSFVPVSFAVANPHDPIAHLPSAIGSSNPYAHLREMVVLHGIDGTRTVRRNFGDGRDYGGCAYLIPDFGDHGREEYDRRVGATTYHGRPTVTAVSVTDPVVGILGKPNLRIDWSTPIEGPCDQAAAWNRSSAPTSVAGAVSDRWVIIDTNDRHTTLTNYEDANWVGYIDMFGAVIVANRYR